MQGPRIHPVPLAADADEQHEIVMPGQNSGQENDDNDNSLLEDYKAQGKTPALSSGGSQFEQKEGVPPVSSEEIRVAHICHSCYSWIKWVLRWILEAAGNVAFIFFLCVYPALVTQDSPLWDHFQDNQSNSRFQNMSALRTFQYVSATIGVMLIVSWFSSQGGVDFKSKLEELDGALEGGAEEEENGEGKEQVEAPGDAPEIIRRKKHYCCQGTCEYIEREKLCCTWCFHGSVTA